MIFHDEFSLFPFSKCWIWLTDGCGIVSPEVHGGWSVTDIGRLQTTQASRATRVTPVYGGPLLDGPGTTSSSLRKWIDDPLVCWAIETKKAEVSYESLVDEVMNIDWPMSTWPVSQVLIHCRLTCFSAHNYFWAVNCPHVNKVSLFLSASLVSWSWDCLECSRDRKQVEQDGSADNNTYLELLELKYEQSKYLW